MIKSIGFDVDGVLRDLATKVVEVFEREYPHLKGRHLPISRWPEWSAFQNYFPEEVDVRGMTLLHLEELWTEAPPYPGVVEAVRALEASFEIHIVTTQLSPKTVDYTRQWLVQQGIVVSEERYHITRHKADVRVDVLVDDMCHNLEAVVSAGIIPICVDQPWNRGWKGTRIHRLSELPELLAKLDRDGPS